jgi:magnesium chelatase subunit I
VTERANFPLLPYSYVVGQETLRRLLEVAYLMGSSVGGVLVSGERGTAKSTIVRSFATMVYEQLPVTLPINATDDRVMGGWEIDALIEGNTTWQDGLLKQADDGMLYIDEVNLLDDHIINLILDVASTGVLVVERDGIHDTKVDVSFMLVGTMNPDEGPLRPQLLDRFGLFVPVTAEQEPDIRREILYNVLKFDIERGKERSDWLDQGRLLDRQRRAELQRASDLLAGIEPTDDSALLDVCARVAEKFNAVGHRAEIVMARAACAVAAIEGRQAVTPDDVARIAPYAVMHRRRGDYGYADGFKWTDEDRQRLEEVIMGAHSRGYP